MKGLARIDKNPYHVLFVLSVEVLNEILMPFTHRINSHGKKSFKAIALSGVRHNHFHSQKNELNKEANRSINIRTILDLISQSFKKEADLCKMTRVVYFNSITKFLYTRLPCLCPKLSPSTSTF